MSQTMLGDRSSEGGIRFCSILMMFHLPFRSFARFPQRAERALQVSARRLWIEGSTSLLTLASPSHEWWPSAWQAVKPIESSK